MQDVNGIFAEFAACFVGDLKGDADIVHAGRLDRRALDYSLDSLKAVDAYLEHLHRRRPWWMRRRWRVTVLWCGAYVGEAIRRNAPRRYDWVDFDEFLRVFPETSRLLGREKQLATCVLLTAGAGSFTLPINKVFKFLHNGSEDSVHFYARCEVRDDANASEPAGEGGPTRP